MTAAIGVFAKAPVPGKTKTRLARVIGDEAAAALHVAFLGDTLELATKAAECVLFTSGDPRHRVFLEATTEFGIRRCHQEGDDLGIRMMNAIDTLLEDHETGILIGSDAPSLPLRTLLAAQDHALSFGPSSDGGFYLVGARKRPHFEGIEWSSPRTLSSTMAQNPGAHLLEPWFDVDEWDDLQTLQLHLQVDPNAAPRTSAWLGSYGKN